VKLERRSYTQYYKTDTNEKGFTMRDTTQSRLASVLTFLTGAWLLLSPIFISITGGALASLLVVGAILVVAGAIQYFWENTFPSWIAALAALYLFVSALSFTVSTAVMWSEIVSSVAAFIFATWDGVETSEVHRLHQHRAM
jgi:hypothetical protein